MQTQDIFLKDAIRKQIGYRILVGLLFIIFAMLVETVFEVRNGIGALKAKLNSVGGSLSNFTIAQLLVNDEDAAVLKIKNFNESNKNFQVDWIKSNAPSKLKQLDWTFPFEWNFNYPLQKIGANDYGYFNMHGSFIADQNLVKNIATKIALLLLFSTVMFLILYPLTQKIPMQLIVDPINEILSILLNPLFKKRDPKIKIQTHEIKLIEEKIFALMNAIEKKSKIEAIGRVVAQVAHDIRSPLAALNIMVKQTQNLPSQQRIMIHNATARINDIANNLLSQYRQAKTTEVDDKQLNKEIVAPILDAIISEKRMQYYQHSVAINLKIPPDCYAAFSLIHAENFKRIISNVLNNAVEAIQEAGIIDVNLFKKDSYLHIAINDTGCGMSKEMLNKILAGEIISTKRNGHGIGLSLTQQFVKEWNGMIAVESKLGQGTSLTISLPVVSAAVWFAEEINLVEGSTVVILDDDQSIHDLWQSRIGSKPPYANISLVHLYKPEELLNYDMEELFNPYYLIDFEFVGSNITGSDIIEKLNLDDVTLVTSRYESAQIQVRSLTHNVKILPKYYAAHVAINILSCAFP